MQQVIIENFHKQYLSTKQGDTTSTPHSSVCFSSRMWQYQASILVALLAQNVLSGRTCISDRNALQAKLDAAKPKDVICIANGKYEHWKLVIKKNKIHVTLEGEEGGKVFLDGNSQVKIFADRCKVSNIIFTAPLTKYINGRGFLAPLEFANSASGSEFHDIMIIDHAANKWARVRGTENKIHHCTFKDKPAPIRYKQSQIIVVSATRMRRNEIHHNRFMNFDPDAKIMKHKHDGAEAIYVKVSKNQGRETTDFNNKIHHNYLHKMDAEQETIGIKASGNEVYKNAIEECFGGISLRHGKRNTVQNNYLRLRNIYDRDNYGIGVHDSDHIVQGNWVIDAGEKNGIRMSGSDGPDDCSACHVRAKNVTIMGNTLINSALRIGRKFPKGNYKPPENIQIENMKASNIHDFAMIGGEELYKSDSFEGNPTTFLGKNQFTGPKLVPDNDAMKNIQPLLSKTIIWRTKPDDLGDHGKKMIKMIKCNAGTSWEEKLPDC